MKSETLEQTLEQKLQAVVVYGGAVDAMVTLRDEAREDLLKSMKRAKVGNVQYEGHTAVRFMSTTYEPCPEELMNAISGNKVALEELMPRKPAVGKVRLVIDGDLFAELSPKVRRACIKRTAWRLGLTLAKKKKRGGVNNG